MKIAVVTGTSTGIGFATSLHLARHGYRVFAGMRNLAKAEPLRTAAAGLPVEVIALDVTSGASIDAAFRAVASDVSVGVILPMPTFMPAWNFVPRWRTRIEPARTISPP